MSSVFDFEGRRRKNRVVIGITGGHGDVATAIAVILVGVFLLLKTTGLLPAGFVISFWAVVCAILGVALLFSSRGAGRGWGIAMLAAGVIMELNALGVTSLQMRNLWPAFIIGVGILMLWQAITGRSPMAKALESNEPAGNGPPDPGRLQLHYVFSGTDRKIRTKNFKGGTISAIVGGFKLDLSRAEMEGDKAVLEVNSVLGGGEIIVPESWLVVMETSSVFGGFEDKTRHFQTDPSQPTRTLIVRGSAVFGGVVVRND